MTEQQHHILGSYTGSARGPLIVLLGGMHGNEPAGVIAIQQLFTMLADEPLKNPAFSFKGKVLGIRGNIPALKRGVRYLDQDLNRIWDAKIVDLIKTKKKSALNAEEGQLLEIENLISHEISSYRPSRVIVLDIHTTTAGGGIFTIVPDNPEALEVAAQMHSPVVTGMNRGIHGTTMDYFVTDRLGVNSFCIAFEAGQHHDPNAPQMAIAAIVSCFRALGSIRPDDVESRHDVLLQEYAYGLPQVAEMVYKYEISGNEHFSMLPGYKNFQPINKGEILAKNQDGIIQASTDGLILMPHYQKAGNDGFFIVRQIAY